MIVHFVGAGPGDPELLTLKAERLLTTCRICIYAGSLVSPGVLTLIPAEAEKHDSAGMSHEEVIAVCKEARDRGIDVVRLHSGDPSIYGATREQMNALDALAIPYDVCPGVSSFQAAAAALCTELTAPEVSQTIVLTRAAGRTPLPEAQELDRIARTQATLCIFLSVGKIAEIAATLAAHYGPDCPAAVVFRASWPDELHYPRDTGRHCPEDRGGGNPRNGHDRRGKGAGPRYPGLQALRRRLYPRFPGREPRHEDRPHHPVRRRGKAPGPARRPVAGGAALRSRIGLAGSRRPPSASRRSPS